jgi:hypothetical protein
MAASRPMTTMTIISSSSVKPCSFSPAGLRRCGSRNVPQRLKPRCDQVLFGTAEAVPLSKTDFFDGFLSLGGREADLSATAAKAPRLHPSQQSCLGARPPVETTSLGFGSGFRRSRVLEFVLRIGVVVTMWSIWFRRVRFLCSWCGRRIRSDRQRSRSQRRPDWNGGPSRRCRSWGRWGCGEGI